MTHSRRFAGGTGSLPPSLVAAGSGGSARTEVRGSLRRGSVLVLVMTLLGILFVVGVAFLATMNFEADMISAERVRAQSDGGVEAATESAGAILHNSLMAGPGQPFGDSAAAFSATAFAEMPGVQNSFSPIEPIVTADGRVVFNGYFDAAALSRSDFAGPVMPPNFSIYSSTTGAALPDAPWVNGQVISQTVTPPFIPLGLCPDGKYQCNLDTTPMCLLDPENPGSCVLPRVADADGDGVVDSLLVDAKTMGLSDAQLADLSARVNPASNLNGKVSVALRVVPHGGMVNLNDSHPTLIQNVFDIMPDYVWPEPPNASREPESGFRHSPKQRGLMYAPVLEEPLLRRRNHIPSREFQPSYLHGNPIPNSTNDPDMATLLFWRDWSTPNRFQDVFNHRFSPLRSTELVYGIPDIPYWSAMMEPSTATLASPPPVWNNTGDPGVIGSSYDRRHLVTTVSHDDLLARTAEVDTPRGRKDLRQAMIEANWTAWDPDDPSCIDPFLNGVLPFEYLRYPSFGENMNCCAASPDCMPDALDGRLQLSISWVTEKISDSSLTPGERERVHRTIHDAFFLFVRNAIGPDWNDRDVCTSDDDCESGEYCRRGGFPSNPGRCTSTAPYWDDIECAVDSDCHPGDFYCDITINRCIDPWTHQRRNEALVSRTAASLTANFIDSADEDDIQTRIALRHFSFGSKCVAASGGRDHNMACDPGAANPCPDGGACPSTSNTAGRDVDLDPAAGFQKQYVYGTERHPYFSEVVTINNGAVLNGRAVELSNPHPFSIDLSQYVIFEVDGNGAVQSDSIPLSGMIPANIGLAFPSVTFASPSVAAFEALTAIPILGTKDAPGNPFTFESNWTLYLARLVTFSGDTNPTPIVVDQIEIKGQYIGVPLAPIATCGGGPDCWYSIERHVTQNSIWTVPVPRTWEKEPNTYTLGTWNTVVATEREMIHPVQIQSIDASDASQAFPTTGSLLLLMREADRSFIEFAAPLNRKVVSLAQSSKLDEVIDFWMIENSLQTQVTIDSIDQIDNGRLPIFDLGDIPNPAAQPQYAHHVAPQFSELWNPSDLSRNAEAGAINTLPWGQLLFDYFTALPLSNGGPYAYDWSDPDAPAPLGDQQVPRVDEGGLRVHGRINLNAAPWKVLAGLPLVPLERFNALPTSIVDKIKIAYPPNSDPAAPQPIGPELAQGIVAYRDARSIANTAGEGTGNYGDGSPATNPIVNPPTPFARGWVHANPAARRGTGLMSVGELANVRHPGATGSLVPPGSLYRIDAGVIGSDPNKNKEDFISAAAVLIALGDWVSVRSHVFTVYGQIRGADDMTVPAAMRLMDTDARAIRFQETIDRLPVLQGRGRPARIGERTVGKYTDINND